MALDTYAWVPSIKIVKDFLEIEEPKDEATIVRLTNAATAHLERRLRRTLISRERTKVFDGNGETKLLLPHYPITAIANVYLWRTLQDDGIALGSDYYEYDADDPEEGILYLLGGYAFSKGERNCKVVWTGGYTTANIPADLVELLLEYVAHLWRKKDTLGEERIVQSMEGSSVTFARDYWTTERARLLRKYARIG